MSKLQNPFGNGKRVLVTQTYHAGGNNIAIDCVTDNTTSNTPVYAISSGTVTTIAKNAGSYLCKTVDGAGFQEFYVHTARWVVSSGQHVNVGDLLGYIATKAENGGYAMHLHIGLSTGNYIMNYFDHSIDFKTTYQDIANDWFNGNINNPINWALFQDLNIGDSFSKGDRIVFTGEQNIRVGNGLKYNVESSTYAGMKATIIGGPRIVDGYTWYDIQVDGGGTGWVADVNKFKHYTENENSSNNTGSNNNVSSDMELLQSLKQKVEELEKEVADIGKEKQELIAKNNELLEDIDKKNAEIKELKEELKQALDNTENYKNNYEVSQKTVLKLQEEIDKLKESKTIESASLKELLIGVINKIFS